jgi:hypothetical protein
VLSDAAFSPYRRDALKEVLPLVDTHNVTTDKPITKALTSFAKDHKVDWIALASPADGEWSRWWRGSVVDSLLRQTDLPILTLSVDVEHRPPDMMTAVNS